MQDNKKNMSMCMSSRPTDMHLMLASITKASVVYSKDYDGGTLYALIHKSPAKRHSTLDKNIAELDSMLMTVNNTSATNFRTVSSIYSGKIKTFENKEHADDPLFQVIFNVNQSGAVIGRKYKIQYGVRVCIPMDTESFDVVKKRKAISAASEAVGVDVTSAVLGGDEAAEYFHQFSSEVLGVFSIFLICPDHIIVGVGGSRVGVHHGGRDRS